jgi:alkylhydroperoxidase/carboxymuconolactone decarboxylase family protein YurZ
VPFKRDLAVTVLYAHVFSPPPRATSIRPDLPPAVDGVLAKAMAKQPDDRFASCDNFAEALREALGLARYDPSGRQLVAAAMAVSVEQTIIEHVQGTVSLGVQAKQILALIDAFAARPEAPALITAVHELEDPDAPADSRKSAKGRLNKFVADLSGKVEDAALTILGKYLESKLGL